MSETNFMDVLMSATPEAIATPMADVKPGQVWCWDGFLDGTGREVTVVAPTTGSDPGKWDVLESDGSPNTVNFMEGLRPFWTLVQDVE